MPNLASSRLIPVTLLTGFLGSGKTTLLNHLLQQPEFTDTLVIINEFGEIALDHLLVAHSTENNIIELGNGCLCCSIRQDLVQTLSDITWRFSRNGQRQFQRVLIETTGLADPTPIIQTLRTHPKVSKKYQLDSIISTVDMALAMDTLSQHPEALKQIAVADILLLTKSDLCTEEHQAVLQQRLAEINPAALRLTVQQGEISAQQILNFGLLGAQNQAQHAEKWLNSPAYFSLGSTADITGTSGLFQQHRPHHHDQVRSFCFRTEQPITEQALQDWLQLVLDFIGHQILRMKGIVYVQEQDRPVIVHSVQHILHPLSVLPAWPSDERCSSLVFITQGTQQAELERLFESFQQLTLD